MTNLISFTCECDNPTNRLDVRFTGICDNSCPFCVEKHGREPQEHATQEELAAKTIEASPEVVGILGGEPMLYPKRVLEYIKLIRPHIPRIYITTSLPFTILGDLPTVHEIIDLVDGFNVSLLAPDYKTHNKILHAKSKHNRFLLLKSLAKHAPGKFRACINLYKGGIDSLDKLKEMLRLAYHCGIRKIKINEIQWDDAGYISYEKIMEGVFTAPMPPAYACGCYTELPQRDYFRMLFPELDIKLHRSCWKTTKAVKPTLRDILKDIIRIFRPLARKPFRVLYEDGLLSNGWLKNNKPKTQTCEK
jgi:pyruvate-formate lyase-activating enzyme